MTADNTAHYTPMDLALEVTRKALEPHRGKAIRVCDPACGNGVFLEAAITVMSEWLPDAATRVFGGDIDKGESEIAGERVRQLGGSSDQVAHWDALLGLPKYDAYIGNPPFLGGGKIPRDISKRLVDQYDSHGLVDLCAYFLRLVDDAASAGATIGYVMTSSIDCGQTRVHGLKHMVANGWSIYDARRRFPWPGNAAVLVSTVCLQRVM